jgi:LPS export ABC transporter protein LptC
MINSSHSFTRVFSSFFAALCACCFLVSCENDLTSIREMQKSRLSIDEASDIVSYLSQSGKVRAKLTAPQLLRYYDSVPRVEFEKSLHVDFYDDSLKMESYLDAKRGYYYEQQGKVTLTDSVVVIRIAGDTLRTKELYWDQLQHKLFTRSDVEIRQKTKTIFGKGFESDEQLRNFKIDSVRGVLMVGQSKFVAN